MVGERHKLEPMDLDDDGGDGNRTEQEKEWPLPAGALVVLWFLGGTFIGVPAGFLVLFHAGHWMMLRALKDWFRGSRLRNEYFETGVGVDAFVASHQFVQASHQFVQAGRRRHWICKLHYMCTAAAAVDGNRDAIVYEMTVRFTKRAPEIGRKLQIYIIPSRPLSSAILDVAHLDYFGKESDQSIPGVCALICSLTAGLVFAIFTSGMLSVILFLPCPSLWSFWGSVLLVNTLLLVDVIAAMAVWHYFYPTEEANNARPIPREEAVAALLVIASDEELSRLKLDKGDQDQTIASSDDAEEESILCHSDFRV